MDAQAGVLFSCSETLKTSFSRSLAHRKALLSYLSYDKINDGSISMKIKTRKNIPQFFGPKNYWIAE